MSGLTRFGFKWDHVRCERVADVRGGKVISITPDNGPRLQVWVSPKGKSVRVWRDNKELS